MDDNFDIDFDIEVGGEEQVLELVHNLVSLDTPAWYMNPDFKVLFADEDRNNLDSIADSCELELAPTLTPVLESHKPPSFSFFKNLPAPQPDVWAVYCIAMEKTG